MSTSSFFTRQAGLVSASRLGRICLPVLLLLLGMAPGAWAQRTSLEAVTITAAVDGNSTPAATTYYSKPASQTPIYQGANLGGGAQFDRNTGSLNLTGASLNVNPLGAPIVSAFLDYRIYKSGTTPPGYSRVSLDRTSANNTTNPVTFALPSNAPPIDVLAQAAVFGGGTFSLEISWEVNYNDPDNGGLLTKLTSPSNNTGAGYVATFQVQTPAVAPPGSTTTWISNSDTNWLNPANWSNGVPSSQSDAVIPDKAPTTPSTVAPLLNDPAAMYEVRNLNMPNGDFTVRSLLRLGQSTGGTNLGATLRVYGNLFCPGAGLLAAVVDPNNVGTPNPQTNSTLVFAGSSDQFLQGTVTCVDVRIEGGGNKKVNGNLNVTNTLKFETGTTANIVTTDANGNYVADQGLAQINLRDSGTLLGENNISSVIGTLIADRSLVANVTQTFGNVGLDITTNQTITSPNVIVTRTTGANFTNNNTPTTTVGIKRIFGVSGTVNNSPSVSTIVFRYLDTPAELNGIQEQNLTLFRTTNGNAGPFVPIGGVVDTDANTITRTNLTAINTITAGDRTAPLPVTLVAFNAVRVGNNAQLTWTTATETNNKGFAVQVSTDGAVFRTLAFVDSQNPNGTSLRTYNYTDTEAGKNGTRYYRLQQTDLDGKTAYSPTRTVSFSGAATATTLTLTAAPNPFTNEFSLSLDGNMGVTPTLITLTDMAGRTVRQQRVPADGGSLSLGDLSSLGNGLYLVRVSLSDGSTKTVRVQKQ